ncbi:MAG: M48 family metalloprotease [Candidatus Omnitrophica bacterium]|nr:M48 family metalloprotease [Candidatus Omnitrophota bacterium]
MHRRILILALISGLANGCAYVDPLIQDFNVVSVDQERQLGEQMAAQIEGEMAFSRDAAAQQRVQKVGQRLVASLNRRDFNYEFFVVQDKDPNAFTIPGGKIYVHTGLLQFADNESEIAGVIGHEIAHAYLRHPAKGISRQLGAQQLAGLLFKDTQGKLKTLALQMAGGGILTRYSRQDEYEADEIGYQILKSSGYKTDGLLRFLRKLQGLQTGSASPLAFLSTHPPTPDRIARLESMEMQRTSYLR